jgi:hypothetical protein
VTYKVHQSFKYSAPKYCEAADMARISRERLRSVFRFTTFTINPSRLRLNYYCLSNWIARQSRGGELEGFVHKIFVGKKSQLGKKMQFKSL